MLDELKSLAIFAKVVQLGSFRKAGAYYQLSPSVVSHHISCLEQKIGTAILYRSTRKLSLTEQGKKLYIQAKQMADAAQYGLANVNQQVDNLSGSLTLTIADVLKHSPIMSIIAEFSNSHPNIVLNIRFKDAVEDMVAEGIDIAIRIGQLKDSSLKSRCIYSIERSVVASPAFMKNLPPITTLPQLEHLPWIAPSMLSVKRTFIDSTGSPQICHLNPKIKVDSVEAACQLALLGAGVTSPPNYLIAEHLQHNRLIALLPDWRMQPLKVYLIWHQVPQSSLAHYMKTSIIERCHKFLENG